MDRPFRDARIRSFRLVESSNRRIVMLAIPKNTTASIDCTSGLQFSPVVLAHAL